MITNSYFIWNGVSSATYGWLKETPFPVASMMGFEYTSIPNRSVPMVSPKTYRDKTSVAFELQLKDRQKYDTVYSWLNGGDQQGKLIVSDDTGKYYKATCTSVQPKYQNYNISSISITFTCLPFRYSTDTSTIYVSSSQTIKVGGNYYSEPKIKINGSGSGVLTVNGSDLSVYVDEYLIVDSERLLAYKGDTILLNQTTGDLPRFQVGENSISFSGGITSLEIDLNERWL